MLGHRCVGGLRRSSHSDTSLSDLEARASLHPDLHHRAASPGACVVAARLSRSSADGFSAQHSAPPLLAEGSSGAALRLRRRSVTTEHEVLVPRTRTSQAFGGLTSLLLAGSCVHDVALDPEVGSLVSTGHVDILSARICAVPGASSAARSAPAVSGDSPLEAASDTKAEELYAESLRAFLSVNDGVDELRAEQASCIASMSIEEEGGLVRTDHRAAWTPRQSAASVSKAAPARAAAAPSVQAEAETSHGVLASMEEEEESEELSRLRRTARRASSGQQRRSSLDTSTFKLTPLAAAVH